MKIILEVGIGEGGKRGTREDLRWKIRTKGLLRIVWKPNTVESSKNIYVCTGNLNEITKLYFREVIP